MVRAGVGRLIVVDIATKIIPSNAAIWVIFPGLGRRFLDIFLGNDAVFLDTPGIRLSSAVIKNVARLRQHTRMSGAVADYVRKGGTPPSRNPTTYSDDKLEDGHDRVLASNVRKLFGKVKKGDLVIVPGKQFAPVYFGEVVTDFDPEDSLAIARYPNEEIPVRKVKWLNDGVPRHQIPLDLQMYLSKPPAIAQVARSAVSDRFFNLAYPSFVLAEKSAVIMDGPQYDGKHPLATYEANVLVSYFISAFSAIEREELTTFAKLDVFAAIDQFFDESLVQSFSQNFNSPGKFALAALSAAMAVFVSGGIAISLKGTNAESLKSGIEVTNSVSPHDAHIAKDAGVKLGYLYKSLHKDDIDKLNGLAKRARKNIGLRTPVKVERKP